MYPDLDTRALAARICNADSISEAIAAYRLYAPFIADYKFIFAAEKGGTPGFAVNRTFKGGAAVRSLFGAEKVFVLDPKTLEDMHAASGEARYPFDFSISLDTMAMSYLEPYISGIPNKRLPEDFQEVFEFIARDEVNVDPLPYMTENRFNLDDSKAADRIFAKLKAYEVLRTLDKEWLSRRGEVRSVLTPGELDARALSLISGMYEARHHQLVMEGFRTRHRYMYACLLKMASIQLRAPSRDVAGKMSDFLAFCDEQMATIFAREAVIARAYFERGQDLTFFGKIQRGRKDLLDQLSNMAWDLWHIRQLEEGLTLSIRPEARYYFTALLTFDKRLIEIMDLYALRSFGYNASRDVQIPVYGGDWFHVIGGGSDEGQRLFDRFYSEEARRSRDDRREAAKADLTEIVTHLEVELRRI